MSRKSPGFLDMLQMFVDDYLPNTVGLSTNTVKSYKCSFRLLIEYVYREKSISSGDINFETLDFDFINAFLNWLEQSRGCSIATRNQRMTALSSFATYAQNRSLDAAMFANVMKKIPVKKQAVSPRTIFTLEEVAILLELPDKHTKIGLRDCVMLNFMYASGARAQEVCDLTVRSIQFQTDVTKLTLTGKNQKTRRIRIAQPCGILLRQYIKKRGISKELDLHIFSSQIHEHMKTSCITEVYKKYVGLAKERYPLMFRESTYTPHSMRHTSATHMLEAGVPIMAIKNFLGHASVHTTERYAALTQTTVNNYIREWNSKWFPQEVIIPESTQGNSIPPFLH